MAKEKAKKNEEISIEKMINEKITSNFETILADSSKFDSGNNAAGKRIRKGLQEIKVAVKEIRDAVTEVKNSRK
jgi:hypothetical protein